MNEEQQLKLQALLDGELPEKEARSVASWVAQDAEAAGLLMELRNTRQALAGFESGLRLPESREFYWSKIARRIEQVSPPEPARAAAVLAWLRRLLVPAGALATVAAVLVVSLQLLGTAARPATETSGADAFTYHDFANGTTLVWLDFPAER